MIKRYSPGSPFKLLTGSGLRLGLTLIITVMVISSPIFMLVNPASAAPSSSTDGSPSAPSTIGQDGSDFTTQAALSLTRASQTNNFVASKAYYDISFRTATAGVIKSVVMDFPTGTSVGSANFVEATGIGTGTIAASAGEVLTYTVTNAVNVPANTIIRIQISNINNPPTPSASFTVSITTIDAVNMPIDGPTPTFAYNMVQVGNAQIAPGAVTTTKIANGAVTTGDLADGSVTSTKIADGTIMPDTMKVTGTAVNVPPQTTGSGSVECPASHPVVTGGGFTVEGTSEPFMHASDSLQENFGEGWGVFMFNSHPTLTFFFRASATCMAPMP